MSDERGPDESDATVSFGDPADHTRDIRSTEPFGGLFEGQTENVPAYQPEPGSPIGGTGPIPRYDHPPAAAPYASGPDTVIGQPQGGYWAGAAAGSSAPPGYPIGPAGPPAPGGWPGPPAPGGWPGPPQPPPPQPPPPRSRPGRSLPLGAWIAIVVILLAGVGFAIYVATGSSSKHPNGRPGTSAVPNPGTTGPSAPGSTSSGPTSTAPSSSAPTVTPAQLAADKINSFIDQSAAVRSTVNPANKAISACTADDSDIQNLQHASDVRQTLLGQLSSVDFSQFADGPQLETAFSALLTDSSDADQAYARWGRDQLGCSGQAERTTDLKQGDKSSVAATSDKKRFLSLWNPIAEKYGLPARTDGGI